MKFIFQQKIHGQVSFAIPKSQETIKRVEKKKRKNCTKPGKNHLPENWYCFYQVPRSRLGRYVIDRTVEWEGLFFWVLYRDSTRDGCIKEFIKRKWSSGLFWAVVAAEKKNPNCHKYATIWGVFFSTFCGQKHILKNIRNVLASELKSYIAKKILKIRKVFHFWIKQATDLI